MTVKHFAVVIFHIHSGSKRNLLFIGETGGFACRLSRLSKNRKENGGGYRDNGDGNEQFDQRKS